VARINGFRFLKRDGRRIWLREASVERKLLDALREPDEWFKRSECRIIKEQRKIRIGRFELTINGVSTPVYVKRYNAFSWRYKLVSLFLRSAALRSLRGAFVLGRIGVHTAKPLAVLESRRWGILSESFFISEEIASGFTIDNYWWDNLRLLSGVIGFRRRRRFLRNLAGLFCRLHNAGIYHNDLKDANILVVTDATGSEVFYLLDLEGVQDCFYLSQRRRVKNLVQLNRTLGCLVSGPEKLYWLRHYLGRDFEDSNVKRRWLGQILRATRRADQKPRKKRDGQPRRYPQRRVRHRTVEKLAARGDKSG